MDLGESPAGGFKIKALQMGCRREPCKWVSRKGHANGFYERALQEGIEHSHANGF